MRWVSNQESVRKGELSALAIAETLIAMGLSIWIAVRFGTVTHVVIGACIAPFLLLRTDESAVLGIRTLRKAWNWLEKLFDRHPAVLVLLTVLIPVPIRVFATIVTVARSPLAVVRAIPRNWRRIVIATDSRLSPEVLPTPDDAGLSDHREMRGRFDLYRWLRERFGTRERTSGVKSVLAWLMVWLVLGPLVGLPAFLYRWSLKSTAIIWFPLLWALRPVGPSNAPLEARLRLLKRSDFFRFLIVVSLGTLTALAGKLIYWNELAQAADAWNASIGGRILSIHVAPGVIEWWQLFTALNSTIAIGLWLYMRSCLRHYEEGVPRREIVVERMLAVGLFVRRLLTSYTIPCVVYLYLREATSWQLPPLGGKPFPWM